MGYILIMSQKGDEISAMAMRLPECERKAIAQRLWQSCHTPPSNDASLDEHPYRNVASDIRKIRKLCNPVSREDIRQWRDEGRP